MRLGDHDVKLSPKGYDIPRLLARHVGKVLTHRHLLEQIWEEAADVQYLRVCIRRLRQKFWDDPYDPRYITTETSLGYRLRAAD